MKQALLPLAVTAILSPAAYAGSVLTDGPDIKLSTKGGLSLETADKSASFKIGGRLQWDYDATEVDEVGRQMDTEDFDVRRARVDLLGHFGDWAYKAQFNVAESSGASGGTAEDLYLRYTGFGKQANITVGKQKEPFGLEQLTSSNDISALERSAMTEAYTPGRSGGIQVHGKGPNWTYGVGLFEALGDSSDDFASTALTGRVTFAPLQTATAVLHLGAGFSTREGNDAAQAADFTGDRDVYNLELAFASGPFHAQAEYFELEEDGDRALGIDATDGDGYYVQAGWIVTGESRPYQDGAFKRVKPSRDTGAWEVVLRYEEGLGRYSDIGLRSVEGEQYTLGLNYYANDTVRLGLSYMSGEEDVTGWEGEELRARIQFAF